MLKTGNVVKFMRTLKTPVSFDTIWTKLGVEITESLGKEMPEEVVKSDLYMSLIEDERIIMVGQNEWALREAYSLSELSAIEKTVETEEAEVTLDDVESDETKELKLVIIDEDDDDKIELEEDLDDEL
jgi:DNA-directed RNA polymerase delta subunit